MKKMYLVSETVFRVSFGVRSYRTEFALSLQNSSRGYKRPVLEIQEKTSQKVIQRMVRFTQLKNLQYTGAQTENRIHLFFCSTKAKTEAIILVSFYLVSDYSFS